MREVMGELGVSIVYLLMGAGYITLMVHFISHIV
jgi:hypothetical protein